MQSPVASPCIAPLIKVTTYLSNQTNPLPLRGCPPSRGTRTCTLAYFGPPRRGTAAKRQGVRLVTQVSSSEQNTSKHDHAPHLFSPGTSIAHKSNTRPTV